MKFTVVLSHLRVNGLTLNLNDRRSFKPYIKLSFDGGFKKLIIKPFSEIPIKQSTTLSDTVYNNPSNNPSPTSQSNLVSDIEFQLDCPFEYETAYHLKLHHKYLSIKLMSKNPILADSVIGELKCDLHTIVTGPVQHDLPLYSNNQSNNQSIVGRVSFRCRMEQISNVTVYLKSISLSSLPMINDKQPISHLVYGYSASKQSSKHSIKTPKIIASNNPEFRDLLPVKMTGTITQIWQECIEIDVRIKGRSRETSVTFGSVRLPFKDYHKFDESILSVTQPIKPTPDWSRGFDHGECKLRAYIYFAGLPQFVQMVSGVHTERGVIDGQRFTEGVQLPSVDFYSSSNLDRPITTFKTPPKPPKQQVNQPINQPSNNLSPHRDREPSITSQAAAREYENRDSIYRKDDGSDPTALISSYNSPDHSHNVSVNQSNNPSNNPPNNPSNNSSVVSSRHISRSNSIDGISARLNQAPPSSQSSYPSVGQPNYAFVNPPQPPPRPSITTGQCRINLSALSIDDPKQDDGVMVISQSPPSRSHSGSINQSISQSHSQSVTHSPLSANHATSASPQAHSNNPSPHSRYGQCAVCGQTAPFICAATMKPVCSYACKMSNLATVTVEPSAPPASSPQAVSPVNRKSVYPSITPPGPVGYCVVCDQPAQFICRDTQLPVCSKKCEQRNVDLNVSDEPGATQSTNQSNNQSIKESCVVCGKEAEFKCCDLAVPVCSRACKQTNMSLHHPPPPPIPQFFICPHCTYANPLDSTVCEICQQALVSYAANPHVKHVIEEQKANISPPKRPSIQQFKVPPRAVPPPPPRPTRASMLVPGGPPIGQQLHH